jgi:hypothetical protein
MEVGLIESQDVSDAVLWRPSRRRRSCSVSLPGTFARPAELAGIAAALAARGRGVIEVVPRIGERDGAARENSVAELAWMEDVSRASGRPLTFAITPARTWR